jgi:RNA polymerase sigma factor (sigma-70 family)
MNVVSDDELVFLVRQKQDEADELLQLRMQEKLHSLVKKFYYHHRKCLLEEDDLWSVALKSFYIAIDSYQHQKVHFDAYVHVIVERELMHIMRHFNQPHHHVLDFALSLDEVPVDGTPLYEVIGDEDKDLKGEFNNPFYTLLEHEDTLSLEERIIIAYARLGYSFKEIGKVLKKNYRQVTRMVKKLKEKMVTDPD